MTKLSTNSTDLVFSIRDSAKDKFLAPFLAETPLEAKRFVVQQMLSAPESLFSLYPTHYSLYKIGTFDHTLGIFKNHTTTTQGFKHTCLGTFDKIKSEFEAGKTNGK